MGFSLGKEWIEEEGVNKIILNEEKHKKGATSRNGMEVTLDLNSTEGKTFPW